MSRVPSVCIGLYTGRYVSGTAPMNVLRMAWALSKYGMWGGPDEVGSMEHMSSCRVDSNRNYLIHDFLNNCDADYLFILDEDMQHAPETPVVLASRGLPVVSGLYFRRDITGRHMPQMYTYKGQSADTRRGHGTDVNDFYEPMVPQVHKFFAETLQRPVPHTNQPLILCDDAKNPIDSGLMRIDAAGFGCLMISREAAEALDPPYLRDQPGLNGDLTFFKQCREKGIEVWGDCSVIASHAVEAYVGVGAFADYTHNLVAGVLP